MSRLPLLLLAFALPLAAAEPTPYDQVRFSVEAGREVANDEIIATLQVVEEAPQGAPAAEQVNRSLRWALDQLTGRSAIEVLDTQIHTQPVYERSHITGYRVQGQLRLRSRDSQRLAETLGELQGRLDLRGLAYQVSADTREALIGELTETALAAFHGRAERISQALGRGGYRILSLDIHSDQPGYRPPGLLRAEAMSAMDSAPPVSAGQQRIEVRIQAAIELDRPR